MRYFKALDWEIVRMELVFPQYNFVLSILTSSQSTNLVCYFAGI